MGCSENKRLFTSDNRRLISETGGIVSLIVKANSVEFSIESSQLYQNLLICPPFKIQGLILFPVNPLRDP